MEGFLLAEAADPSPISQQVAIHMRDVTLVFNNHATVLNGLSLDVLRGSMYGILGPSGCGKSSLLRCILGMHNLTSGSISVFGQPPDSEHLMGHGSTVGYMAQSLCLSPQLTIAQTLAIFGTLYGLDGTQLRERCQFLIRLLELPQTDQLVGEMSDGLKRRVSLAVALIHEPSLLVLDEPTVGMDPQMRESLWQHLADLCENQQVTVLFSTHYIDDAKNGYVIGLMRHGQIFSQGSPTVLLPRFQMGSLVLANVSNVNFLPYLCQVAIFSLVPVRDLLQVGRVCTKWRWLQRQVVSRVRKLTLVICGGSPNFTVPLNIHENRLVNDDDTLMYPQEQFPSRNSVHFDWLDLNALIGLSVTLSNVSTLELAFNTRTMSQLVSVTILLRLWQSTLINFKLRVDSASIQISDQTFVPLFEAINSMRFLRHLTVLFFGAYFSDWDLRRNTVQLKLPILTQLEIFHFHSSDLTDVLINSMRTYAVTNASLRLHLSYNTDNFVMRDEDVIPYYQMGREFCGQFDRLNRIELFPDVELEDYCDHFSSLTTLQLSIETVDEWPIDNLFRCLAQLTRLVHLKLFMDFGFDDEGESEDALPVLPSIKSFVLMVFNVSNHNDLSILNIPWTMPNLQLLDASIWSNASGNLRCGVCDYDEAIVADGQLITREAHIHCLSQTMLPLADCKSLHTISVRIEISEEVEVFSLQNLTLEDLGQPLNLV